MRQKTSQRKTLYFLEQILLKYDATKDCVGVQGNHGKQSFRKINGVFKLTQDFAVENGNKLFGFQLFIEGVEIFPTITNKNPKIYT